MVKMFKTKTCPKCVILGNKLKDKNIEFDEVFDLEEIIELGFRSVPVLMVNGEYMDFGRSISWIKDI